MADPDYTDEIWKPIPFATDYAVSDFGRVKRIVAAASRKSRSPVGKILAARPCGKKNRYLCVNMTVAGQAKNWNVHRLVARTFLGEPPSENHEVAHGDGNGHNNRLGNLGWKTPSRNAADKLLHGTHDRGTRSVCSKLDEASVLYIRASSESQSSLGKRFGVAQTTIGKIKRRVRWGWL